MSTLDQSGAAFRAQAVVVGGSAGAVEVLGRLLPGLPSDSRVPVIVCVHLAPRRPSLLRQLFAARCRLPVREPDDKQPVGPGIWFAPPDYHLLVESQRCFALSIDQPVKFSRPSIDVLFESAAEAYGPGLLGVVLTGANDDGALGACAIRKLGGVLAVQDPQTAESSEMPKAAIRAASPQFVGSVEELASILITASGGTP
ncbi:MAG TPA: chemotaxis protein CheB [Polyangiales bacterium]|nr:chemotaxis protein CheB [Polyangiales bacterium]